MNPHCTLQQALQRLLAHDTPYHPEAYGLVLDAVRYTASRLPDIRHISGRELLNGLRDHVLDQYGPMARLVLEAWGVRATEDVGEIVFRLIDAGWLARSAEDARSDFRDGFRFAEAFDQYPHYRWPDPPVVAARP